MTFLSTLYKIASMYYEGSGTFSALTTLFKTLSVSDCSSSWTIPGQSIKYILFVKVMYCQVFVSPGIGATLQQFFFINVLITELFPAFGYPINPTLIFFLSLCRISNCFKSCMRDPFPNGFYILAWNARVGVVFDKYFTHLYVTDVGIKSHLLRMKTRCLLGHLYFKYYSMNLVLVPFGSLASRTYRRTSELSMTL